MRRGASVVTRQYVLPIAGFGGGIGLGYFTAPRGLTLTRRPPDADGADTKLEAQSAVGYNHQTLVSDQTRVRPYAAAIEASAAGRRALDIGTGPACLLARLCLRSGAASVDAVEYSKASIKAAIGGLRAEVAVGFGRKPADRGALQLIPAVASLEVTALTEHGNGFPGGRRASVRVQGGAGGKQGEQELTLYEGLSTDPSISLSGGYSLVVHELLGDQAGAEGAAAVVADIRARGLATKDCVFLPRSSSTLIAPTTELRRTFLENLVHRFGHGGSARIETLERYQAVRFHRGALLAEPQALEVLDFQGGPSLQQDRMLEFYTDHDGDFDGMHMHLHVDLDGTEVIDVLDLHNNEAREGELCTWNTTYVRLLEVPLRLPAGSRIALRCRSDLAAAVLGETQASEALAHYSVDVSVGPSGAERQVASLSWRGG
mmetsp:Transcript_158856/g.509344  ORF Transcript_158856/g.509344 Transcript_158856/m.509344 type:complete len:431 (-) Transcript_158856:141-1433(-)